MVLFSPITVFFTDCHLLFRPSTHPFFISIYVPPPPLFFFPFILFRLLCRSLSSSLILLVYRISIILWYEKDWRAVEIFFAFLLTTFSLRYIFCPLFLFATVRWTDSTWMYIFSVFEFVFVWKAYQCAVSACKQKQQEEENRKQIQPFQLRSLIKLCTAIPALPTTSLWSSTA